METIAYLSFQYCKLIVRLAKKEASMTVSADAHYCC